MNHTTSSFTTTDHLKIHTEAWLPDSEPKAVVIIVHGYDEHIGRYPHVAKALVDADYAVYGLDHRGHGKSEGEPVYVRHFSEYVDDLSLYVDSVKAAHTALPLFLYGHSMGSMISLDYALRNQHQLTGIVTTGCPITADETVPGALLAVSGLLARIIPKVHFTALDSALMSKDSAVVAAYDADPLISRKRMRIGLGTEFLRQGKLIRENAARMTIPILIMHGEQDGLIPKTGSEVLYDRVGSSDKTLKIYPGLYHEIHNEPEQDMVLADIVAWLDAHVV